MAEMQPEWHALLESLNRTFDRVNETLSALHRDNDEREQAYRQHYGLVQTQLQLQQKHLEIHDRRLRILRVVALAAVAIVFFISAPVAVQMYRLVDGMADDMQSMAGDMRGMAANMTVMSENIHTLSGRIVLMTDDMRSMAGDMRQMAGNLASMHTDMNGLSADVKTLTGEISFMRQATVSMDHGMRRMTTDMSAMSNTISPVMHGFQQFMPWPR